MIFANIPATQQHHPRFPGFFLLVMLLRAVIFRGLLWVLHDLLLSQVGEVRFWTADDVSQCTGVTGCGTAGTPTSPPLLSPPSLSCPFQPSTSIIRWTAKWNVQKRVISLLLLLPHTRDSTKNRQSVLFRSARRSWQSWVCQILTGRWLHITHLFVAIPNSKETNKCHNSVLCVLVKHHWW